MRCIHSLVIAVVVAAMSCSHAFAAETVQLSSLDLSKMQQDWGKAGVNKSLTLQKLSIGGKQFKNGVGTHAVSVFHIDLKGGSTRFTAQVGVDDEVEKSPIGIRFIATGDGRELWKSGIMKKGMAPEKIDIDLTGVKQLTLIVDSEGNGIDFAHADWADATFTVSGEKPVAVANPILMEEKVILTPKAPATPRINGAKVFGVRPGNPFLYTIPATGDRPMTFAADGLPPGLTIDAKTGQITGSLKERGEYVVTFRAENALGKAERKFKIVCGDKIALTPPMGWNSWNCFAHSVDAAKVRSAAGAMVKSGLANHGWTYINIDDCWEIAPGSKDSLLQGEPRDSKGMVNANKKFPDMKALCDYIHGKGLKAGIYSSPGPLTCAGFTGSYKFEDQDAKRYADWGFDYLKYDWCSYGGIAKDGSVPEMKKPFQVMRDALDKAPRDIVYSVGYGVNGVWTWGAKVGGNCWRTTDDITDTWGSMTALGFSQNGHEEYAGPGQWNDTDMLIVGMVGWGNLHPTRLTPNEQYTHISLWCLLNSPLLIGCDMAQLDDFTLSLLTNDEVLEVNQDSLGKQASLLWRKGNFEVWAKDMEDGSKAVGLFNRGQFESPVTVRWSDLGISGKQIVRDLWRQKDLGTFDEQFTAPVGRHGVVLIRVRGAK